MSKITDGVSWAAIAAVGLLVLVQMIVAVGVPVLLACALMRYLGAC